MKGRYQRRPAKETTVQRPERNRLRTVGARTWSIPAKAYWLSGPDNHHQQAVTETPDHPQPSHRVEPSTGDPATPVASAPGPANGQGADTHRPQRNLHRPRHGRRFTHKQRLAAGTGEGGNAHHEDHGRL